jgi:hypothetical protein
LRITDRQELGQFLKEYAVGTKKLILDIHEIMWYMRGSVSREEAWTLCFEEREAIKEMIAEKVKNVEKSGLPIL